MYLKFDGTIAPESAPNDGVNIWADGPDQTVQGDSLNDVLGGSGNDTLIGGSGDNQYYLSGTGNTIVQGATGTNTVTTWMSYALPDNIQNLTVTGDNLYAEGNALDNLIAVGDSNNMTLYGAGGNNVLVGGSGTDVFVIDGSPGSNAVYNWHSGDAVRLLGGNFQTFAEVQAAMTQVGPDVVLQNGENNLVIRDTTISQFQPSDFYIALDPSELGQLTFDDEFNTLSLRTASNQQGTWTAEYGDGDAYGDASLGSHTLTGNGELEIYTQPGFTGTGTASLGLNPFSISNGVLDIHAQTVTAAQSADMWGYDYSSGVLTTRESFSQTYGYFEMRAELPTDVSGAWPAFWLLPADGAWPPELDVMETLSGSPNIDYTTVHTGADNTAIGSANLVTNDGGWHTYGVLWTATEIIWYLDGQEVFQTATPADMHQPMYMVANLAVGGWAGTPDFTSTDMYIDYIRAYALSDGSSTWTSSVTPDTPSSTGDASSSSSSSTGSSGSSASSGGASSSSGPSGASSGSGSSASSAVSVSDASYTAPNGVTSITLSGSHQTVAGNGAGDLFVSNDTGNVLIGGAGNDTFDLGRGGDVATGGGGVNKFVLAQTPWAADEITDFGAGQDTLDIRGMLTQSGYTGSDPIGAGYLKITTDAKGNAQIWSDLDHVAPGSGWWLAVTLDGVSPSSLQLQDGLITMPPPQSVVSPSVTVTDATYVAPAGVTSITLAGSAQAVTGNDANDTFIVTNNSANHIYGGTGNDSFILGRGGDVVTGGGGADTFVFNETPWAPGQITDFNPQHDVIDLSGLLARSDYVGSDPIGHGYIRLASDANGNAQIWSDLDQIANAGWWLVTTLDGVSVSSISMQGDFVTAAPPVSSSVTVSDAAYTAPLGVGSITLSGSNQTITGNALGDTFVSNDTGNHLIGGTGADTFDIGRGGDVVTGGGGSDTFNFAQVPWAHAEITDFNGRDTINLTGMFASVGYTGANPLSDGHLQLVDDGAGDAQVWFNADNLPLGTGGTWEIVQLDHTAASSLHVNGAFITG